jgi:PadR family transcriptional regulator PadR
MEQQKNEVEPGTLSLMVLKTLSILGSLHGYGIARRIEQMGWISSQWRVGENNRRAKYYSITRAWKKQLAAEEESWRRASEIMFRSLEPSGENT